MALYRDLNQDEKLVDELTKKAKRAIGSQREICLAIIGDKSMCLPSQILSLVKVTHNFYETSVYDVKSVDEFWCDELKSAVKYLLGEEQLHRLIGITEMLSQCQFSHSPYRRSYHSKDIGYYVEHFFNVICGVVYLSTYDMSLKEMMLYGGIYCEAFSYQLAYDLKNNDEEIVSLVKEAILGENDKVRLSYSITMAVIISGNEELIEDLTKLLLAAKLQEGVRQEILEKADAGSVKTFLHFLNVIAENDLLRFSSVKRAFSTWSGIAFDIEKKNVIEKTLRLAIKYLDDEDEREKAINSSDAFELYFSMWATANIDIVEAQKKIDILAESKEKYKILLALYFAHGVDNSYFSMKTAEKFLDVRDEEILAWVCANLANNEPFSWYNWEEDEFVPKTNTAFSTELEERKELFNSLSEIARFIGKKNRTFEKSVFPWATVTLNNKRVLSSMISIVCYDLNDELIAKLMEFVGYMDAEQRRFVYSRLLNPNTNNVHRRFIREALFDKSVYVKEIAVKKLSKCSLLYEDVEILTDALKSKSGDLRQGIIAILKIQNDEFLSPAIDTLLNSKNEYQVQAGLEILNEIKDENEKLFNEKLPLLESLKEVSTQTEILLDKVIKTEDESNFIYTEENGFGIYNPDSEEFNVETYIPKGEEKPKGFINKIKNFSKKFKEAYSFISNIPEKDDCLALFERMNNVFEKNADYEYEYIDYSGTHTKILFGDCNWYRLEIPAQFGKFDNSNKDKIELEMIPFYEEFIEAAGNYAKDVSKLLCVVSYFYIEEETDTEWWFNKAFKDFNDESIQDEIAEKYDKRECQITKILELMIKKADKHTAFEYCFEFYKYLLNSVDMEKWGDLIVKESHFTNSPFEPLNARIFVENVLVNYNYIVFWRACTIYFAESDDDFKNIFLYERFVRLMSGVPLCDSLKIEHIFRAYDLNLIGKDLVYYELLKDSENMRLLTKTTEKSYQKTIFEKYPFVKGFLDNTVERIVEVESLRGELETPLTHIARNIYYFEGAFYFVKLLSSLGKETFYRGYDYTVDSTKKAVLSFLLKHCYPAKDDTPEVLRNLISDTDITDKRLAEASVYAPQWSGIIEKVIGWKGLKSAVWLFHAHINETFTAEKETEVALYSPISATDFNDGAFDKDWFFSAYNELGEKRFNVLYKSAKYITSGSTQHRRSQLYADAVLGKIDANELEKEIIEKRNQEKLRCYPLIPFDKENVEEALHRYLFIQRFLKESKQFGAQRRENESKACNIALRNLAITTGFMDVNRMTWFLESENFESVKHFMSPTKAGDIEVYISVDLNGVPSVTAKKGDKILKNVPKAYAKNETVLTLKETVKGLREQHKRARQSFETAMAQETKFTCDELLKLMNNPILSPMVKALVWMNEEKLGFLVLKEEKLYLKDDNNEESVVLDNSLLKIAHPYDFVESNKWASYQYYLYQNKIVQPFKQVFREFYPITEDELEEGNISHRYAGNQIQPKKTISLLKGRGWTVDYEDGLQKVYYKENLVLRMYAYANWFSPADIEAPTIEEVSFFDRKTDKLVDFKDVPPIVFSESMRDIDLVVSVAHIGGVDPEASHSTVEMRIAIVTELLKLMKINNVSFIGSHAKIKGSLGNYSVHMGSGVVHAEAVGAISILPVHSQHRGRIFLPFADDDPKTAEIVSKILLLSEDKKIKDETILRQISGH